ncbi:ABC transporter permease [Pseudooceanicola sp. MF1-13]|uniref:ABC transporter permease n=1 Tax=Pseudooceanicola sp. MF1-13 TaxID=3379095 RepID=UPI003892284C
MRSHAAFRAIGALIIREIATSYGRTPGGYLWALLEPIAAVGLLATIFSIAFDAPPLGRDFALFYATGYLPFAFYSDLSHKIGVALRYSRPLLAYPSVTWADAITARFLLNSLTHLIVASIVISAMLVLSDQPAPDILLCATGFLLAAGIGLGFGTLNAFLFEFWPIWERLWSILNRPAFILSGVLFLPDAVPPPFHDLIWLNPLVQAISFLRAGVYQGYAPPELNGTIALFPAAVAMLFGLLLLRKTARDILWQN